MAQRSSPPEARARRAGRRLIAAVVALGLLAHGADRGRDALSAWIDATPLPPLGVATGTEVLARDGSLLRAFPVEDGLWRLAPPQAGVDPQFLALLVAWEDRRFATHPGVDPWAVLRAGAQAAWNGRAVSGASTLSMQTARLLERGPTGDWRGKLRQARLALALERRIGKDRVLDLYLRLAPYGGNTEGVRAASLMWFGKEPRRLTAAEAALLVALPQSPEERRPDLPARRAAALAARNRVIDRGEALGILMPEAAETARATPLPTRRHAFPALAPLLADRLRRENPGALRIETTIDPILQRRAEALAARAAGGRGGEEGARMSAALILADHRTGEILAHVGAAAFADPRSGGFIDMTQALRSPGSTLKPLVYALGFDDGIIHPETLIEDRPAAFGRWQPENFDRRFRGTVTIRQALVESLNIPVVRVAEALGPARIAAALRRAGAPVTTSGGSPGLALVLGGGGVSLEGLVTAYGGLARGGKSVALHVRAGPPRELSPFVGPVAAWYAGSVLAQLPPPGGRAGGRVAYKTGTSYGHRDALAVGYDGRFVAGVWMGRPDGTPVPGAFGGDLAAPLLFDLFDALGARALPLPPPPAAALTVPNAALPAPLRRFSAPGTLRAPAAAPQAEPLAILFPPDGAEVELARDRLVVRVRGGRAPYTWLMDGRPVAVAVAETSTEVPAVPGWGRISVIDADGASVRAGVRLTRPGQG